MGLAVILSACSSQNYNPTVYSYTFNEALAKQENINTVMIAPINFDKPSRYYLNKNSAKIDAVMKEYLTENGIKTRSTRLFERQWKKQLREYGDFIQPSTGLYNRHFKPALQQTLTKVFDQDPSLQAVIFTDIISTQTLYHNSSTRMAQWHGVERKLKVQGLGEGVSDSFNWAQPVDAISISVYIFNRQQELILHNVGGIQVAQALELQNSRAKFKRRKDLLNNEQEILEAVALSMHPLITMKNYPDAVSAEQ